LHYPLILLLIIKVILHQLWVKNHDRQSSDQNFSSRGHDRQSSEQSHRKLISLHNNSEDDKHAHDLQISSLLGDRVEDLHHFLFECKTLRGIRQELFEEIETVIKSILFRVFRATTLSKAAVLDRNIFHI
jgi:hypothetical protein